MIIFSNIDDDNLLQRSSVVSDASDKVSVMNILIIAAKI